ncbi:MAG: asparagine synthase [Polyangiaceae bacterium]|nr:asparagine synthase [Polyangiaceae bacterium]
MGALYGFAGAPDRKLIAHMGEALRHRGREAEQRLELPWVTLAVRPRLPPGTLHAASGILQRGPLAVALAGLLFGRDSERDLDGWLARVEREGEAALSELRGAFVLALADERTHTLTLMRDAAGVRTAYHARAAGRVLFAVEPKGVLACPDLPRRPRPAALAQYLTFSFVPGEGTLLEGVRELLPGHAHSFQGGEERVVRHFRFEEREPEATAEPSAELEAEWAARFREAHAHAVAERRPRGETVGVFLSGGLDSSVVTAELTAQHDATVRSYSLWFGPEYPHELEFARAVARRAGTEHTEVLLRPKEFLPELRRIAWHLDDPIGDPITVPNFMLAARVARDVRFIYNGEGGDPVFGGPKNIPMMLQHWYGGIEREPGFRERAYLASFRRGYEEWPRLLAPAWASEVDARRDLEGLLTPFLEGERPRLFLNKLTATNLRLKGAHLILPKVDRMTGAAGLVPLSPLFDDRLIELSFAMPAWMKLRHGIEKRALKLAYAGQLPPEVVARPKSGMRVPVHWWMQGDMKRYARRVLAARELRRGGILEPQRVRKLLDYDIEEGPGRYGLRIWMLLTLELWRRLVVEREAP